MIFVHKEKFLNLVSILALVSLIIFLGFLRSIYAYDTEQATRYADKWWDSRNPFFHDCGGHDCANFVSQCLIAGGLDLIYGPGYNQWGRHSIVNCDSLHYNLIWYQSASWAQPSSQWDEEWYSISSPHPYPNDYDYTWTITKSGAQKMKVHFSEFETEDGWDYVYIYDKSDNEIASYTGSLGAFWSAEVNFKTIKIRLVTNNTITDYGFDIDEYAYEHIPAPSTIEGGDVIMFGDESDNFEHAVIVVGGSGDNAYCNAHSADHYHTSWTDWVDGTLPNPFTITNFYEIPSYAGGQANLTSYTPEGWDDPLIISSVTGTHTDGPHFIVNEPSYIDWTILNDGYADIPDTVYYVLLDDGDEVQTWFTKGLWYNHYTSVVDYEYTVTSEGWHTISISADPDDYWDESDEYDNSYSEYWNWIEHGVEEPSDINQAIIYSLQIFPNPFFKRTKINYSIASKGDVILRIYDASGRLVKEFMAKNQNPGHYKVMWGCKNKAGLEVSAGIYYVKLFSRNYSLTQKMVLIQ